MSANPALRNLDKIGRVIETLDGDRTTAIVACWHEDISISKIAEAARLSRPTVYKILRRHGIEPSKSTTVKISSELMERIPEGMDLEQILAEACDRARTENPDA